MFRRMRLQGPTSTHAIADGVIADGVITVGTITAGSITVGSSPKSTTTRSSPFVLQQQQLLLG